MSFKTTLVLLVLALALGAFWFAVEKDRPTQEDIEKNAKRLFPDWKADDVLRVTIARPGTATAEVEVAREKGGAWRLEKPVAAEASASDVDALLSSVSYADFKDSVKEYDPRAVGLETPALRVTFTFADKSTKTVSFGKDDIAGRNVYAHVEGGKEALLLPKRVEDGLAKAADDLREKRLFTLDRWLIDRVTLKGPKMELRFKKDGEFWMMDSPENDFADKQKVDEILTMLANLRAKRFLDEAPADLATFGLGKTPLATVTLEAAGVSQTALLGERVGPPPAGGAATGGEIFAKSATKPNVVAVDDAVTAKIIWEVDPWRSKRLFNLGRERVTSLGVKPSAAGAPAVKIVREEPPVPGSGGLETAGGWRFAEPRTATADTKAVEDLVKAVSDLEVSKVARAQAADLANFGLDKPVTVTLGTPKGNHTLRIGRTSPVENGWYMQREGRDAVFEVIFPLGKTLLGAYPVLLDRHLTAWAPSEVVRLDVSQSGAKEPTPFVRLPDGGWSTPGKDADSAAVEELAERVASLEATRILPPPDDLQLAGLAAPWLTIKAVSSAGAAPQTITIELGKATPERDRLARLTRASEPPVYFALSEETVNVLAKDLRKKPAPAPAPPGAPTPAPATGTAK